MQSSTVPLAILFIAHLSSVATGEICTSSICKYEFVIGYARTMTYQGFNVKLNATSNGFELVEEGSFHKRPNPLIGTSVGLDQVIAADGYKRTIITINGKFPGPDLEVIQGAQIVVRVVNDLPTDSMTIHWHGLRMRGTPWMDGVPDVSHCPIPPQHSFTYRFLADPVGTLWYHSHMIRQRLYGLKGMVVIHPRVPTSLILPYHLMTVGDWFKVDGHTHNIMDPASGGTGEDLFYPEELQIRLYDGTSTSQVRWQSGLINGKGRIDPEDRTPLSVFRVMRGLRYRFRMVGVGAEYALSISIDNHMLTVVATDGYDVEPITVEYITLHAGETVDFELEANQIGARFWIRAKTLQDIEPPNEVRAILHYDPFTDDCDPTSLPRPCTQAQPCRVYNCGFKIYPAACNMTCTNLEHAKVTQPQEELNENYGLDQTDVREIFINMGIGPMGVQFNGITYTKPSSPLFHSDSTLVNCDEVCGDRSLGCACTHKYTLEYMKPVRFIVSNYPGMGSAYNHPFHMHGHHYAVLHVGYPHVDPRTGAILGPNHDVICDNSICDRPRWNPNMANPPQYDMSSVSLKNTAVVPAYGYIVIQIMADNPGYWLSHCHMASHQANGMTFLIEEAPYLLAAPPAGFPTCYDYNPTDQEFAEYLNTGSQVENPIEGQKQFVYNRQCDMVSENGQRHGKQGSSTKQAQSTRTSQLQRLSSLLNEIYSIANVED